MMAVAGDAAWCCSHTENIHEYVLSCRLAASVLAAAAVTQVSAPAHLS